MRIAGVSCLITWSVRLRDFGFPLSGISLGRCDARRKNAGGKALIDPSDRCSLSIQLLDSRLDVSSDLVGAHGTPVDELGVGAAECL